MVRIIVILLLACSLMPAKAQDYTAFRKSVDLIRAYGNISDSALRVRSINTWWDALRTHQQIPLVHNDSVAFLYRGEANTVEWMGDFNAWGYHPTFPNKGKRIAGTDVWILLSSFPLDARLDYKIVVNGATWMLDPDNNFTQWSGVGGGSPNSELRMPQWKEDPNGRVRMDIAHGKLKEDILLHSDILGYQINFSIYFPANFDPLKRYASLYVTDGYEYLHPKLGNMVAILDNLLADQKIKPLLVIFVDQREPINRSNNKRMDELAMNGKYLGFYTNELIPYIESHYPVIANPNDRGIMGSSMGGLSAAYFAFSKPGVFGLVGIQSPSFSFRPQIFQICNNPQAPIHVSMTSGLINDASDGSRRMKDILQTNACSYQYREVNEGHSWGNWRNLIDDILIDLYGNP